MYIQVVLYVFLRPSFCCQLKQMSMLLLYTVIQYVIALLYVIIKQVDNFKDKVHAKKKTVFWLTENMGHQQTMTNCLMLFGKNNLCFLIEYCTTFKYRTYIKFRLLDA